MDSKLKMTVILLGLVALITLSPYAVWAIPDSLLNLNKGSPIEVVGYFINHRYPASAFALGTAWDEERELLKEVKAQPTKYLSELEKSLQLPENIGTLSLEETQHCLSNALYLALELGPSYTIDMIKRFSLAVNKKYDDLMGNPHATVLTTMADTKLPETHREAVRQLLFLRHNVLRVFQSLDDPFFVKDCLSRIEYELFPTRNHMLRYLRRVAHHSGQVKEGLEQIVNNKSSPLHNDKRVQGTIAAIAGSSL